MSSDAQRQTTDIWRQPDSIRAQGRHQPSPKRGHVQYRPVCKSRRNSALNIAKLVNRHSAAAVRVPPATHDCATHTINRRKNCDFAFDRITDCGLRRTATAFVSCKAALRTCVSESSAVTFMKTPIRLTRAACCACAASGHAAAALPIRK
jgi:hypothetical protein